MQNNMLNLCGRTYEKLFSPSNFPTNAPTPTIFSFHFFFRFYFFHQFWAIFFFFCYNFGAIEKCSKNGCAYFHWMKHILDIYILLHLLFFFASLVALDTELFDCYGMVREKCAYQRKILSTLQQQRKNYSSIAVNATLPAHEQRTPRIPLK